MLLRDYNRALIRANSKERILNLRSGCDSPWRVLQFDCDAAIPIEAQITLSGGDGPPGRPVQLTFARTTMICLPGTAGTIEVENPSNTKDANVEVRVHGTQIPIRTTNVWTYDDEGSGGVQTFDVIPAYAVSVRLDIDTNVPATRALSTIGVIGSNGALVSLADVDQQPPLGLALGMAEQVQVTAPLGSGYRLTYYLGV